MLTPPPVKARVRTPPPVYRKQPPRDCFGRQVPADKMAAWQRQGEIRARIERLKDMRLELQRADGDPLYVGLDKHRILASLRQAEAALHEVDVYCVCPVCSGIGCKLCASRGLVSRWRYDALIPAEFKP